MYFQLNLFPLQLCLQYLMTLQIQQYKHERECSSVIEQTREYKISRLESLVDGVLPIDEFMEEEFISLTNEYKVIYFFLVYVHF